MTPEILLNNLEFYKNGGRTYLIESLKSEIKCNFVKKFTEGDERCCETSDFLQHKKNSEVFINKFKIIFEELLNNSFFYQCTTNFKDDKGSYNYSKIDNELLALILIMCGENVNIKPWNTNIIKETCSEMLNIILKYFNCEDISKLISIDCNKNVIKNILQIMHPKLLPNTWKYFPASVVCYKWILKMIKQPDLSMHIPNVLPTALLLVDDFVIENKIIGVECLNHIVDNCTIAELQFYGYGDVIYNALMPLLRLREGDLISPTILCLVSVTIKLETDFKRKDFTKWSRFDSIFEIILENMELEQLVNLRNCYILNLEFIINASGFGIIRWSKRLLRIFKEYIEIAEKYKDKNTSIYCLKAIEKYIAVSNSKLMVKIYGKKLIIILLMALDCTLNNCNSSIALESKEIIIRCIKTLLKTFSEKTKTIFKMELEEKFKTNVNALKFYQEVCNLLEI